LNILKVEENEMKRIKLFFFILVLLFTNLYSCSVSQDNSQYLEREEKTDSFNNIAELKIQNITGDIEITSWEKDIVEVTYIKKAKTKSLLEDIEVTIEQHADRLSIETDLPKFSGRCSVQFLISIPQKLSSIYAKTVTGSVHLKAVGYVENLMGRSTTGSIKGEISFKKADLNVVTGGVDLDIQEFRDDGVIDIHVTTGRVKIHAPADFNAAVDFKAVTGSISTDFSVETTGTIKRNRLVGKIGRGIGSCTVRTVTGSISLVKGN
jgi:DUF4097 and DUF4098 domain-containing protein YvlB